MRHVILVRLPFATALNLLAAASQIAAQEPAPRAEPAGSPTGAVVELPKMIVTATRIEEDPFRLPYSISEITAEDPALKLTRTTPEALRELPSVMLQKTSHGQGSPYLRGFTGYRTLMLVDGIRLNNSTFRDGPNQYWSTIDALSLNRLEVVRGPGSVMYGSDAIGGTVNAISRRRGENGPGADWDGGAVYRFSGAEASHTGRLELGARGNERLGLHVGGSIKDFGDLHGGDDVGRQTMTGYREWDIDAKIDYDLTPHSKLVYGHQTVRLDDAWRTHSTVHGLIWSGTTPGSDRQRVFDQARDLDFLQYHAEQLEGFVEEIHMSLSHQYQGEIEDRIRSSGTRELQDVDVRTMGLWLTLQSPSRLGRWVYGADYYRDWVDSSYRGFDATGNPTAARLQGPVADEASYDLLGAFIENHLPLVEDRLELRLGGRFTYAGAEADQVQDPYTAAPLSVNGAWTSLVGSARLSYQAGEQEPWMLYAGISQGFRAPNLSDLTRFDIARSGEQEIPAFGLEPESFLSPEIGVRVEFERFAAEATYYYSFMDDLIVRVPTGATTAHGDLIVNKQNSGEGFIHGVELAGSLRLHQGWTVWANFTWMRGELDTPLVAGGAEITEPVSRLMPTTVNSGLRWRHSNGRVWAEFATTFAERQDRLASNDLRDTQRIPVGGTPGYGVCHLRAGWNPCRHWSLSAAMENLTNEDYRIHGSGMNEPGRNFILSAAVRF